MNELRDQYRELHAYLLTKGGLQGRLEQIPTVSEWKKMSAVKSKLRIGTKELVAVDKLMSKYEKIQPTGEDVQVRRARCLRVMGDIQRQVYGLWKRRPDSSRMPSMLNLYRTLIHEARGGV